MVLAKIEEAIEDYRQGKLIIIIDDEDRENEGDLCIAAEKVTPEAINFMARFGRGLICMPVTGERLDELQIPMMVSDHDNSSNFGTAFTVSIEAKNKVTTGISAYDRAATILAVIDPNTKPHDIAKPGHMFPLRARPGGVLQRAGQTEASVDMAKLAGLYPAAVICEIMNDDGTMSRLPQLEMFARQHDLKIISIADLIAYRKQREKLIERVAETRMPTDFGEFRAIVYRNIMSGASEVALVKGDINNGEPVLARIHSECLTGDVFSSLRCDCGAQLQRAMQMIQAEGRGLILYMRQEGRGIGLHNKIKAYALQDEGYDTVEANVKLGFKPDLRDYGIGAQILADLGVHRLRLMTNNPKKVVGIQAHGLEIVEIVPIEIEPNANNLRYLEAKRDKMGHLLHLPESEPELESEPVGVKLA
jgi:3,4-dihydroxy 2-butanone 4-phosphate synthase/GTP cyclohydrolase II